MAESQKKKSPEGPRGAGGGELAAPGVELETPIPLRRGGRSRWGRVRREPFLQLLAYYVVLLGLVWLLAVLFPAVRQALFAPVYLPALSEGAALLRGGTAPPAGTAVGSAGELFDRATTTLLAILGALALVVPVARVYMQSKRLVYDPALVRSVVILPIVVAGIALVVKDSIALAFSLAGIVAAVRFRNTLKDPRDAVYIFLVIGIGLSAGVQALDVALVMSMVFNFVVLGLWKFNVGSVYGGRFGETGVVASGEPALMVADSPEQRRRIRRSLLEEAEEMEPDGVLLVHTKRPDLARHTAQEALGEMTKEWRLVHVLPREEGRSTLEYLVRLKKKATAAELVGALHERWAEQVEAAEYFWFRARERARGGKQGRQKGDE